MEREIIEIKAKEYFDKGDYDKSLELYKILSNLHYADAYYCCVLIYEKGVSNAGVKTELAYGFFKRLMIEHNQSEGFLGCARILFNSGRNNFIDRAIKYCSSAIEIDANPFAHLLLGRILDECKGMPKEARIHFLKAVARGAPWGMRLFARSCVKQGKIVEGVLSHVVATILFPMFVLLRGSEATRFD